MAFSGPKPANPQISLFPEIPIFDAIAEVSDSDFFEGCLFSLQRLNFTRQASSYKCVEPNIHSGRILGSLCRPVPVPKQEEIKTIKEDPKRNNPLKIDPNAVFQEFLNPGIAMLNLDITRLPADAMAFYRPFHFEPFEEWGIYLYVEELMKYCTGLYGLVSMQVQSFTPDALLSYVLFEVFHHEFFHHIVECAATTLEIIASSIGPATPLYMNYKEHSYETNILIGRHKHNPLEEALANAYPYNSLSFLSHMQGGYEKTLVKLYKKLLESYWRTESDGYCNAGSYTGKNYAEGAGQLLAMLLSSGTIDASSSMLIGKEVIMNGNSAYFSKPEIPTYLVGNEEMLHDFAKRIPLPHETYTKLFLPGDSRIIDDHIKKQMKDRKELQKSKESS